MKNFSLALPLLFLLSLHACTPFGKRVKGNGKLVTESRKISVAERISLRGDMEVVLTKGPTGVQVSADENLLKYIRTVVDEDILTVSTRDGYNLVSDNKMVVTISTPEISDVHVLGSGNITSADKFVSENKMSIKTTGSGNITLGINCPNVDARITGSGDLNLKGETRNLEVGITGSGNFNGNELKSENADVKISGSGNAAVFADVKLKAGISGSGEIRYKGNAAVTKRISGSGEVIAAN